MANPSRPTLYEEGPWVYKRIGLYYNVFAATNHPGVIDFNGGSYFFYHNGALSGGGGFTRSVAVEKFSYNADGTIPTMNVTASDAPQVGTLNPYSRQEAETIVVYQRRPYRAPPGRRQRHACGHLQCGRHRGLANVDRRDLPGNRRDRDAGPAGAAARSIWAALPKLTARTPALLLGTDPHPRTIGCAVMTSVHCSPIMTANPTRHNRTGARRQLGHHIIQRRQTTESSQNAL